MLFSMGAKHLISVNQMLIERRQQEKTHDNFRLPGSNCQTPSFPNLNYCISWINRLSEEMPLNTVAPLELLTITSRCQTSRIQNRQQKI